MPLLAPFLTALVLSGCSDYDLYRPDKDNTEPDDEETPTGEPDIEVSPTSLDFGGVLKNCPSAPLTLTVANRGDEVLDVYDLALGNPHFSFSDWNGESFQLWPGDERIFELVFVPEEYTTYTSQILVSSNDPDEAELTVPTEGFGDETALYEEGFTQAAYEALDVIWVVDNSGSMGEELDQVRSNFEAFITEFVGLGLDYHLAVITTDMDTLGHQGAFQGPVISPASADPVNEFMEQVNQGAAGSGSERGMDAVKAALTEPLLSSSNAGFLREDAALATIILSDEDDSSTIDESSFVSFFEGLKSDPELVTFNAIVGDPSGPDIWDFGGCSDWAGTDLLQADAGDRYIDVAGRTGGIWRSICYEDYNETLTHVSLSSAGMITEWTLSETPTSSGSIQVFVDGVQIYMSMLDGWWYDADTNTITFAGEVIPEIGQYTLIQYPIVGECSG